MKMRFLGRTCLIVLSLLPAVSTQGGWRVVGSDQPVIAKPGDDVILPCHISPRLSAVDMEVRWFRDILEKPVHLYHFQKNILGVQDRAYQDRTALSPSALQTGDISLKLRNVRPSDRGVYTCVAGDGSRYEEGQTEVIVAGDFFPGVSGWMVAFFLTLALSIGAIPLLGIQWSRMDAMERKLEPMAAQCLRKELEAMGPVPKSEWKWILSSAVDVTLDPDTAHPELTLSAEGKRVRKGETRQRLPDTPERFDVWRCVLGREGFTSGRHYWQVQVGGNTWWRLGVSRESAERKGGFSMTPQQGYWTVKWRWIGGGFTALTDPETPLPRSLEPQKLGVYLDYEEGQLSFYNVETRSHIYTFTDMDFNPNEKLYPLFYTWGSDTDLVLESPDPDPVSAAD